MVMTQKSGTQTQADALEERLVAFAVTVIQLTNEIAGSFAGKHVASQLIRSGTSPAPNYAEARSAESRADFIHKLRIAIKELNETAIWLRIVERSKLSKSIAVGSIAGECDELKRILGASLRTARLRSQ